MSDLPFCGNERPREERYFMLASWSLPFFCTAMRSRSWLYMRCIIIVLRKPPLGGGFAGVMYFLLFKTLKHQAIPTHAAMEPMSDARDCRRTKSGLRLDRRVRDFLGKQRRRLEAFCKFF